MPVVGELFGGGASCPHALRGGAGHRGFREHNHPDGCLQRGTGSVDQGIGVVTSGVPFSTGALLLQRSPRSPDVVFLDVRMSGLAQLEASLTKSGNTRAKQVTEALRPWATANGKA